MIKNSISLKNKQQYMYMSMNVLFQDIFPSFAAILRLFLFR